MSITSHQSIITTATMLQVTAAVLLLLCIQCQAAEVEVQGKFDEKKFLGKWYGVFAASNCPMFNEMKKGMTMPVIRYAMDGNTMKNSVAFNTPEGCQQMDAIMETVASGHYRHKSVHGDNEVVIMGTDYTSLAMEYTKTIHEGQSCITVKLYGRKMEVPDAVKNLFMERIHSLGLKDEDAVTLPRGVVCDLKGF